MRWGICRIISRRNVKEIKMNVISGDNLKSLFKDISKIVWFWVLVMLGCNENLVIGVDVYLIVMKRWWKGIWGICKG